MSDVASLELSKELYELSGWDADDWWFGNQVYGAHQDWPKRGFYPEGQEAPAYTAGYLLRKLQEGLPSGEYVAISADNDKRGVWLAGISNDHSLGDTSYADTPENAACKLAIELVKLGVIKT